MAIRISNENALTKYSTVIKIVGIGGGGSNAVNRMIEDGLTNVEFVVMNTDVQALENSQADIRIPLGTQITSGLGAGGNPSVGEQAALEDREEIHRILEGTDMVFLTAGMGGGTGTGGIPVIASVAKELGILCVAVLTKPFAFEGSKKMALAEEGISKLRGVVDTLIILSNQRLLKVVAHQTAILDAFRTADNVLRQGVQGISDIITKEGIINIDFADVKTIMRSKGDALMGIGVGSGEKRAVEAATSAVTNPMLENITINGANGLLLNVYGGKNFLLSEYEEILNIITSSVDPNAMIISGYAIDSELDDQIRVTVIATGFQKNFEADAIHLEQEETEYITLKDWANITGEENQIYHPNELTGNRIPSIVRLKQYGKLNYES